MGDFEQAVQAWNSSQRDLKEFSKFAARVGGEQTKLLAQECKCSVDRIENYRRAYRLYHDMVAEVETPDISRMWSEYDISIFVETAKLSSKYDLDLFTAYNFLKDGEGLTVEKYRELVGAACDTRPEWVRRLATIRSKINRFYAYIPEMPPDKQVELQAAFDEFAERLERIADDGIHSTEAA